MPLSLLVDIRTLLYALVDVFHSDWLIRSDFQLRRSDNLHKDSHQKLMDIFKSKKLFLVQC